MQNVKSVNFQILKEQERPAFGYSFLELSLLCGTGSCWPGGGTWCTCELLCISHLPMRAACPAHIALLCFVSQITFGKENRL
jgi:hypothetical protein